MHRNILLACISITTTEVLKKAEEKLTVVADRGRS
jgi:hypothetical protein